MTIKASDIRKLLLAVYTPVAASSEFKKRLLKRLCKKVRERE